MAAQLWEYTKNHETVYFEKDEFSDMWIISW